MRQVLDVIGDAPAWVRNGRHDILVANRLGRALCAPVFDDPRAGATPPLPRGRDPWLSGARQ